MVESDWQARAKQRQKRINIVVGALFAVGAVSGALVGYFEDENVGHLTANSIPPWLAVLSAIVFVISSIYGSWKLMQVSDELERVIHTKTMVVAGNIMMIGYPTWFTLWLGGIVPEPDALWLFLAGIISNVLAYVWYKYR